MEKENKYIFLFKILMAIIVSLTFILFFIVFSKEDNENINEQTICLEASNGKSYLFFKSKSFQSSPTQWFDENGHGIICKIKNE